MANPVGVTTEPHSRYLGCGFILFFSYIVPTHYGCRHYFCFPPSSKLGYIEDGMNLIVSFVRLFRISVSDIDGTQSMPTMNPG